MKMNIYFFVFGVIGLIFTSCNTPNSDAFVHRDAVYKLKTEKLVLAIGNANLDLVQTLSSELLAMDSCSAIPQFVHWVFKDSLNAVFSCTKNKGEDQWFLSEILANSMDTNLVISLLEQRVFSESKMGVYLRALGYYKMGFPAKYADGLLILVQTEDPVYSVVNSQLGYYYLANQDFNNAKEYFDVYLANYPNEPNAYDALADYYFQRNNWPQAISYIHQALHLNPLSYSLQVKRNSIVSMYDELDKDPISVE
ncbi:MAG: tetratricopeptide (TPR) repeat protein [Luteibaculaceae bacterium]|jgi:tetratricopeptide (TPR) repeat protein